MSIAITGATGQLGRLVIEGLKNKGTSSEIIALARSLTKGKELSVSVREADYEKPETLVTALKGITTLLLISGNELGRRAAQHQNVIFAAKNADVKRIVYTSLLHADTSQLSLAAEHRKTEEDIRASGVPYTILRNGWYTENYLGSIGAAIASGAVIGSAGDGRISSAARIDFADAAIEVLMNDAHVGATYELAGDNSYTLTDLALEISRQTGKAIEYRNLPASAYAAALTQFGIPEGFAQAIASWDVAASAGALFDESRQLSRLIGRATTPLEVSVRQALSQFK
jgi:NAD(P)H dehydrogenase (quinone)